MPHTAKKNNCLEAAAELKNSKSDILNQWEERVRAEISASSGIDKISLVNSLPIFLDQLVHTLSEPYSKEQADKNAEVAHHHGEERANLTNYSIDQVLFEYQILREVLMTSMQEKELVKYPAIQIIQGFLDRGMRKATSKFAEQREQTVTKFRTIADAMPQMVWSTLPDGFHDYYNQQWYDFTGTPYGSTDGDGWNGMFHPDDQERAWKTWRHSLETGVPYQIEYRLRNKSGKYHWTLGRALPIRNDKGEIVRWMGTCTDIQELKTTSFQLAESIMSLKQERDLRNKFVATLTHDLRTPLTSIKMSGQLILRNPTRQEKVEELAAKIVSKIGQADQMITDLLDANRLRAGEKLPINDEECDFALTVRDTVSELITVHGDRITYHGPSNLIGMWDCSAIRRMVENLVNSAVKYGQQHGPVKVTLLSLQSEVLLTVHNVGHAISEENQKTIFDIYQRAESASTISEKGWGLGLTLVKGVVEAYEGKISLTSSENEGTTFSVRLPVKK